MACGSGAGIRGLDRALAGSSAGRRRSCDSPSIELPSSKSRPEADVLGRRRKHASSDAEDLAAPLDRLREVLLEPAERREDEVAEAVAAHLVATVEAIVEERGQRGVAIGEREQAVSDVAWRQHADRPAGAVPSCPPSSATVTMAVSRSRSRSGRTARSSEQSACFSPSSTIGRPVPPPIATIRKVIEGSWALSICSTVQAHHGVATDPSHERLRHRKARARPRCPVSCRFVYLLRTLPKIRHAKFGEALTDVKKNDELRLGCHARLAARPSGDQRVANGLTSAAVSYLSIDTGNGWIQSTGRASISKYCVATSLASRRFFYRCGSRLKFLRASSRGNIGSCAQ